MEFLGRKETSTRFDTAQTKASAVWDTSSEFPPLRANLLSYGIGQATPAAYKGEEQQFPAKAVTSPRTRKAKLLGNKLPAPQDLCSIWRQMQQEARDRGTTC